MRRLVLTATVFVAAAVAICAFAFRPQTAEAGATLTVVGERFRLTRPGGPVLGSKDLVGAVMEMTTPEGQDVTVRVDAVAPAAERPGLLLHTLSVKTDRGWTPFCDADAHGRRAAFPVAGAWRDGRFVADSSRWFITCTSGSQGKCVLFGYDPWSKGPHGETLVPYYEACQRMVRADYLGNGAAHTRNGTAIVIWDHIGIQKDEGMDAPFEAGWSPGGAVCAAKTRRPELLRRDDLTAVAPRLAGPCNERTAAARGAVLFNRSK